VFSLATFVAFVSAAFSCRVGVFVPPSLTCIPIAIASTLEAQHIDVVIVILSSGLRDKVLIKANGIIEVVL
jgi:hypothetical protein